MDRIKWCLKQRKGIELIEPNENLAKAYINKAENSLKAAAVLKGNIEWEVSSSYYVMYFSLYSLLMKIGIKSEIHSCTISFMKEFLKNYFSYEDIELIERAQKARIDIQYYSDRNIIENTLIQIQAKRALFFAKCKNILNELNETEIKKIRKMIKRKVG